MFQYLISTSLRLGGFRPKGISLEDDGEIGEDGKTRENSWGMSTVIVRCRTPLYVEAMVLLHCQVVGDVQGNHTVKGATDVYSCH